MDFITEIITGSGGVVAGGGLVWWFIGNKFKEMAKDIHVLKELAVNDRLQDQRIKDLDEKIKSHHKRIGGQEIKQNVMETQLAVMNEKLDSIIKLLEK